MPPVSCTMTIDRAPKWFLLVLSLFCCVYGRQVYNIKPANNAVLCMEPCLTIDEYTQLDFAIRQQSDSVALKFLPGHHSLNMTLILVSKVNSTLEGSHYGVIIQCTNRGNVRFINMTDLLIANLSFVSCSENNHRISVESSTEVVFTNVNVINSAGLALFIYHSTSVHIIDTVFTNSTADDDSSFSVRIDSSSVFFRGTVFSRFRDIHALAASSSNITFNNSTLFIESAVENAFVYFNISLVTNNGQILFYNNTAKHCLFMDRSTFTSSGLLQFEGNQVDATLSQPDFLLYAQDSSIVLNSLIFFNNLGSVYSYNSQFVITDKLVIDGNVVRNSPHAIMTLYQNTTILIGDITFSNNLGRNGATAGLLALQADISVDGNVSFVSNMADSALAGIMLLQSSLSIEGCVVIADNIAFSRSSSLSMISSNVSINGSVVISNNTVSSDVAAVFFVVKNSVLKVFGTFQFVGNSGLDNAFCIVVTSSNATFYNTVVIQDSFSDHPHLFEGSIVSFLGNTTISNNVAYNRFSGGGIEFFSSIVSFDGHFSFINNGVSGPTSLGGAVYAIDSQLVLGGTGEFKNNSATRGGALYLYFGSQLKLLPGSTVSFSENTALFGGAIYVAEVVSFINCTNDDTLQLRYSKPPTCFLDTGDSDNVSVIFKNNEATNAGTVLYGGLMKQCELITPISGYANALDLFTTISNIGDPNVTTISSEPFRLCFCMQQIPECDLEEMSVEARRGAEFSVSVMVLNELDVGVTALVRSYLVSTFNDTNKVLRQGVLQRVNNNCTNLRFRVLSLSQLEQLTVYAESPCGDVGNTSKTISVQFKDCPLGLMLNTDTCVCDSQLAMYTNTCNVDTGTIERPTNFWVGLRTGNATGLLHYPNCPFDYCSFPSPSIALTSPDTQCNFNRSGVLCGACGEYTSLLLGSSDCSECSNYYLFLLIPFAFMGVLLVAGLFLLQLTVATGALHGLIFYANIVTVNKAVLVPTGTFKGFSIFLSWLNLDFGIETCFFSGMNQYAKTWLQFVFPAYLLSLVLLIIIICQCSSKASELIGPTNPVAVLATIILLSFMKVLRAIADTFSVASIEVQDESFAVWLLDGNLRYVQGIHAVLFVFSLIVTVVVVFIAPYTLLLLSVQVLQKVSWISSISAFRKLHNFLDAYHAPYKADHRYWTGLILIVRIILLIVFAVNVTGEPSTNLLATLTACLCTISMFAVIGGVYKKSLWNGVEVLSILNLGVLTATAYHILLSESENQPIVASISLFVAFVIFVSIIVERLYQRVRALKRFLNKRTQEKKEPATDLETTEMETTETVKTESVVTHQLIDYTVFREPLLEDI